MTQSAKTESHPANAVTEKRAYVRPELQGLGTIESLTSGSNPAGTEDAVIFAPGGDPAPSAAS